MSEVTTHKFLVELSVYPDGRVFPKISPLGSTNRAKKKKVKKLEESSKGGEVEL